ncbi:YugN family protein [Bacillus xiapuensis]|uniref:YugN family protein n=1 Tax=Bacillus xiapuensis TaxID=2014075 RepID=UPI000C242BAC|nr:YugN family protein [Bacillus xiapuensis]
MKFDNTGLENLQLDFNRLNFILTSHGFVLAGQWDYERVTFDRKFELKEGTYYLRMQAYATEGDIGAANAVVQLLPPLLGKHYYPHGVEYGDDEMYPASLVETCEKVLADVKNEVSEFTV